MLKRVLIFKFIIIFFLPIIAEAQSLAWATQLKGNETKDILAATVDEVGNIYSVGTFESVVDFDPSPGTLSYDAGTFFCNDIFLMKQSKDGTLLWAHHLGATGTGYCTGTAITVGPSGDLYITGKFAYTVDFDPGPGVTTLTGITSEDVFVLRLTNSGKFVWVKQFSGTSNYVDLPHITTDVAGNVIFNVNLDGTFDFDPGPGIFNLSSTPSSLVNQPDIFICKLTSSGNFLWAKQIGSTGTDRANSIKTDNTGNILLAGYTTNVVDFDPGTGVFNLGSANDITAFVSKLSNSGNFIWASKVDGALLIADIATDNSGDHYIVSGSNYSRDSYFGKLSSTGNIQWLKVLKADPNNNIARMEVKAIAVDDESNIYITGYIAGIVDFDPGPGTFNITPTGHRDVAIAQFSLNGELVWAKNVGGTDFTTPNFILLDKSKDIIVGGKFSKTVDFDPGPGIMNLTSQGIYPNGDLFVAKYSKANLISGKIFKDNNGDGIRQSSEPYLSNVILKGTRGNLNYFAISDSTGTYRMFTDSGAYLITMSLPRHYLSILPTNHTINFGSLFGQSDTANNFGVIPGPVKDLRITITNLDAARSGFKTNYRITYTNLGTDTVSGNIIINHDSRLSLVNANPVQSNYSPPTARWEFTNLPPSMSGNIDIQLAIPTSISLGTILRSYVTINPLVDDFNDKDNLDSLYHIVSGSYDPNEKKVSPEGSITTDFLSMDKFLDYTVRFQNTGNDTAFTVIVRDTLSKNFNISSFEPISASHPYVVNLKENGIIEWKFSNILLPDSNINELKSHGFARYRIKPNKSLTPGELIKNKAAIYFDYNSPVITNETINTIMVITAVNPSQEIIESKVFPNPANSQIYVKTKGAFYFIIYDVSGRILTISVNNYNQAVWHVGNFAKGMYFLELGTPNGKAVHKILIN